MSTFSRTTEYSREEMCEEIIKGLTNLDDETLLDFYKKIHWKGFRDYEITKEGLFKVTEYEPVAEGEGAHIVVGAYYEKPDNKIVYIYGANGPKREVRYYDASDRHDTASYKEVKSWARRSDLHDFPDTNNPCVPYVFDLYWDIKYLSQLREEIINGHADAGYMKQLAVENEVEGLEDLL